MCADTTPHFTQARYTRCSPVRQVAAQGGAAAVVQDEEALAALTEELSAGEQVTAGWRAVPVVKKGGRGSIGAFFSASPAEARPRAASRCLGDGHTPGDHGAVTLLGPREGIGKVRTDALRRSGHRRR